MKVTEFTLTIDNFDNAAMADDRSAEVARMLRSVADSIEQDGVPHQDGSRLMDSNGNQVGEVSVDWEDEPESPLDDCETIDGVYGSGNTDCQVFIHADSGWYVVEGGCTVNRCPGHQLDELVDGVDVETIEDDDCFTCDNINTLEEFAAAIADMI